MGMADKKTVMSWLEGLTWDDWPRWHSDSEVQETAKAALELLKEQEQKMVKLDEDSVHCPSCGNELFTYPRQKFCDECGQKLKWE